MFIKYYPVTFANLLPVFNFKNVLSKVCIDLKLCQHLEHQLTVEINGWMVVMIDFYELIDRSDNLIGLNQEKR